MFGSPQLSDEQIILKIRQGDEKMLVLLYKRNFDPIRALVQRNSGGRADAEDILQEALVILWQKAQQASFTLSAKLDTFIYSIARNLWLKNLRKNGRLVATSFNEAESLDPPAEAEGDMQEENDQAAILSRYMMQLSDNCRQLLSLFYFDRLDMEEIAERLQLANAQTAKAKKYQCKKKLEALIRTHYTAGDLL